MPAPFTPSPPFPDNPQAFCGPISAAHQPPGRRSGEGSASILEHMQQDGRRRPAAVRPGHTSRGEPRPKA